MLLYVLIIGGTVNYGLAVVGWRRSNRRLTTWVSARGKIVEMDRVDSGDGHSVPVPIVRFTGRDGGRHEFKNGTAATWYAVGRHVEILYDPNHPESAVINDRTSMWGLAIVGFSVGTAFWILAWAVWVWF